MSRGQETAHLWLHIVKAKNFFARRDSNVGMSERVLRSKPVTRECVSQGSTHIDRRTMLKGVQTPS